jgi:glycosyltransferase involved in cell wall biosynthesis
VLFVVPRFSAVGGRDGCVVQLAQALQERGVRVRVLSLWSAPATNASVRTLRAAGIPFRAAGLAPGVDWLTARLGRRVARRAGRFALRRQVAREARSAGAGAVVHIHGSLLTLAWLIPHASAAGVPVVYSDHGAVEQAGQNGAPRRAQHLAGAGAFTCHSRAAAEALSAMLSSPRPVAIMRAIVSGPASASVPSPRNTGAPLRLVYLGRLDARKGVDVLLRALALVVQQEPGVALTIAGDGAARPGLEALAAELALQAVVTFRGRFAHEALAEVLEGVNVVVHPSLEEGLPVAVLEGMAYGKAMVATAVGGTPDVITPGVNGLLVPPGDAAALAEALLTVVRDPELRARLAAAARRSFEAGGFSPGEVAGATLALYSQALAGRRR